MFPYFLSQCKTARVEQLVSSRRRAEHHQHGERESPASLVAVNAPQATLRRPSLALTALALTALASLIVMTACSNVEINPIEGAAPPESIFGPDGLSLTTNPTEQDGDAGIEVNAYLWDATLRTVAFMGVDVASPHGGVIATGWYEDPATPGERFRANVVLFGRTLLPESLQVVLLAQRRQRTGWAAYAPDPALANQLADRILALAATLRRDALGEDFPEPS